MKRILIATVTFAMLAASVGLGATPKVQLLIHGKLRGVDDVVPLSNRDVVRSGEEIRFELVCDQRAYVYLLALGSSGRISMLQPFSGRTDDALQEAGVARSLPSTAEFLPLDETPGKEILYAFASEEPLPNLSRFVARLESLKRDTEVQETLRGEFPELVALELQHLPGPMSLRPFQPDVTPTPASVLGVEQRGLTSATGTEEPGVLSNQGGVIRSLIGNVPSAALGRGLPLQIPDRTKTEVDRKRSTGSRSNRGSQRGAETGGASNPPAPPKDSDSWWKRLGSVFTANRSAPGPRASASVPPVPGRNRRQLRDRTLVSQYRPVGRLAPNWRARTLTLMRSVPRSSWW